MTGRRGVEAEAKDDREVEDEEEGVVVVFVDEDVNG